MAIDRIGKPSGSGAAAPRPARYGRYVVYSFGGASDCATLDEARALYRRALPPKGIYERVEGEDYRPGGTGPEFV